MKQYILYLSISIILLYFAYELYQHREGIQNKITHIVLLGDSIFQNKKYVPKSKSVEYLLKEKLSIPSLVLAQDNAIIYDIPNQYNSMPIDLNAKSTNLYISIGGNDLLNLYEHNNTKNTNLFNIVSLINNPEPLTKLFSLFCCSIKRLYCLSLYFLQILLQINLPYHLC